ncbi:MAG: nucleotidyltransferase family protein [Oscillospiraceae bacterium]|nr:nucleotidyltransferase family protein [Oscillospiraceae bacterium]
MDITTLGGYTAHLCVCGILGKKPESRPKELSFERIYSFAKSHMVECSAYYGVNQLEEKPDFWDKWTKHISQMSAADAIQRIEFERLCECFENERIQHIPLKGFAIKDCYPSGDMRRMSDLDIYVCDEHKAHDAMLKLGYECKSFGECHHNTYYLRPVMNVEIHTRLSNDEKYMGYFSGICRDVISRSDKHGAFFDVCDTMCYIIYHTYKHFSGGGCGIRAVLDLYLFYEKHKAELDSERFRLCLEELGLQKFYASLLSLGRVWFENSEETALDRKIADYIYSSGAYGKASRNNQNTVVKQMGESANASSAKRKTVFAVMFPDVKKMKLNFPYVEKCVLLLPVAYVHRAFRAVFVKKRLHKLADVAAVSDEKAVEAYELFNELGI